MVWKPTSTKTGTRADDPSLHPDVVFGISGSASRERNPRATMSTTTPNGLWRTFNALKRRKDSSRTNLMLETPSIYKNFDVLS